MQCFLRKKNYLGKPQSSFLVTNKTCTHRSEKSNLVPLNLLHISSNINKFNCILLAVTAVLRPLLTKNAVWEKVKFKMHISASCRERIWSLKVRGMFNFQNGKSLLFLKWHEVWAQSVTKPCPLQNSQKTRTFLQHLLIQVTHTAHNHHMDTVKLLQRELLLPKDTESVSSALQTPLASHTESNISHHAKARCTSQTRTSSSHQREGFDLWASQVINAIPLRDHGALFAMITI